MTTSTAGSGYVYCTTCGVTHVGMHTCTDEDIRRRINELLELLNPRT